MRQRSLRLMFVTLLALVMGFSSAAMAADTVQLGALFPFTGPLALLGQESFNGAIIATDMVNEKGGIWGKQIEWIKGDGVDPKAAMAECERLISVKGMKLIFGTYSSSLSYAASEVTERNGIIYWEQGAIADKITSRGFKYLFRTCPQAGYFGIMAVNFANDVIAPKLGIDPKKMKIAVMYEDSLYGTSVGTNANARAKELGIEVVMSESYSHKTVDLSSVVMKFKSKSPDVIIATSYLEDGLLFWRQAKDLDLNVKAFIGTGAAHGMPDWAQTFGAEGDYIFNIDPPIGINEAVFTPETKARLDEFKKRFNEKFGHMPATHATNGFQSAWLLFNHVLPQAGEMDPEKIREAALKVDLPQGSTVFGFGCKFAPPGDPSSGQNLMASPALMQWQNQAMAVVYPEAFAVAKPLLPMPTWEQRAKGETSFVE